jgi:hypothetical protein
MHLITTRPDLWPEELTRGDVVLHPVAAARVGESVVVTTPPGTRGRVLLLDHPSGGVSISNSWSLLAAHPEAGPPDLIGCAYFLRYGEMSASLSVLTNLRLMVPDRDYCWTHRTSHWTLDVSRRGLRSSEWTGRASLRHFVLLAAHEPSERCDRSMKQLLSPRCVDRLASVAFPAAYPFTEAKWLRHAERIAHRTSRTRPAGPRLDRQTREKPPARQSPCGDWPTLLLPMGPLIRGASPIDLSNASSALDVTHSPTLTQLMADIRTTWRGPVVLYSHALDWRLQQLCRLLGAAKR